MRCFTNGTVILPYRTLNGYSVLTEGETIVGLIPDEQIPYDAERIDLERGYLSPGFIDMHLHGGGGFDFMDGCPEEMKKIAQTHCAHGTTAMCPTTMTSDNEDLFRCFDAYDQVVREGTGGADFLGLHLEGPYISGKSKGAQPEGYARVPTEEELSEILTRSRGHIVRWDGAPELPGMKLFAKTLKEHGILTSIAHSAATAEETLEAFEDGFSLITHMYCATTTEHKVGQVVHGGIIEAAYLEDNMNIELIADGKHIPKETMKLGFKLKGRDRLILVTDSMRAAGTDVTESILGSRANGGRVIIEDGVAKLPDRTFFAGSIGTMDRALRVVHCQYGVALDDTVRAMSFTPARLLHMDDRKGSIAVGKDADLVVLTPDFQVRAVYVRNQLRWG